MWHNLVFLVPSTAQLVTLDLTFPAAYALLVPYNLLVVL